MLLVKVIVLVLLGFVIISLFSGLFFLVKDKGQTNRTVNALSMRIGLSVLAIVIIMIAGATGVIEINPDPRSGQFPEAASVGQSNDTQAPDKSIFSSGGRTRIEE